jgi:putative FmdB family regulatory protein
MVNYHYVCNLESCQHQFQVRQSIKEDALVECPNCHNKTIQRVIHLTPVFILGDSNTVGADAERNKKRLGVYGTEDLEHYQAEQRELAKEVARQKLAAQLPEGATLTPKQPEKVFWRDSPSPNIALANLNAEQAQKFIFEGE